MPVSHEHRVRMFRHIKKQMRKALINAARQKPTDNSKTVRWEITEAGRAALAELEGKMT